MPEYVRQQQVTAALYSDENAITQAIYAYLDRARASVNTVPPNKSPGNSIDIMVDGQPFSASIMELFNTLDERIDLLICHVQFSTSTGICAISRDVVNGIPWTLGNTFALARSLRDFYSLPMSTRFQFLGL